MPRLLPFDTVTLSDVGCFNVGPVDRELLVLDAADLKTFKTALSYDFRLEVEALGAAKVHGGNIPAFPRFVV